MPLTPRQRVRTLLSGKTPDRPIADLGGRVASLNTSAYLDLKKYLGFGDQLETETVTLLNTIGETDERVLEYFDIPIRRVYLRPAASFVINTDENGLFYDEWGVGFRQSGEYNERVFNPLAQATRADLEHYSWPDPDDPSRVTGLAEQAQHLHDETDFSLAAGHISAGIFQDCWNLRGMEQFMVDMAMDPEFANALLDRVTDIHIRMWNQFLDSVGHLIDMVETADDLAGQNGLLISPKMYREFIKPRHTALNQAIRTKTNAKILYHSCGAVLPLIEDLIEAGVQILNPIQPLPGKMNPEVLREKYGDRLIFHGGLDVQTLLPEGSPSDVATLVHNYLEILGPERYIMAPANSIQPGTPPENIAAAYETVKKYEPK